MKHKSLILLNSVIVVTAALLSLAAIPVAAQNAEVNFSAPAFAATSESGEIAVMINGQRVGAFELKISCDPAGVLRFDNISPGEGPENFNIVSGLTASDAAAISGFMSSTPITGTTKIATVNYTVVGKRSVSVKLAITGNTYDPEGNSIDTTSNEIEIQIMGTKSSHFHPIAILSVCLVISLVIVGGFIFIILPKKKRRIPAGGIKLKLE